jgi:hypothetical protein
MLHECYLHKQTIVAKMEGKGKEKEMRICVLTRI